MFWKRKNKKSICKCDTNNYINEVKSLSLSSSLESNIKVLKEILSDDDTLIERYVENQINSKVRGVLLFFDGMVNKEIINENVIQPLVRSNDIKSDSNTIETIKNQIIVTQNVEKTSDIKKLVEAVYNGDAVFLLERSSEALILSSKGWETRSIKEPETEKVLRGPREGFTESLVTNLALIKKD